jgi:hypothetical protein
MSANNSADIILKGNILKDDPDPTMLPLPNQEVRLSDVSTGIRCVNHI